ncbi:MAG: hypothetical protein EHM70_13205, partial [Chloroflexota bacterium]
MQMALYSHALHPLGIARVSRFAHIVLALLLTSSFLALPSSAVRSAEAGQIFENAFISSPGQLEYVPGVVLVGLKPGATLEMAGSGDTRAAHTILHTSSAALNADLTALSIAQGEAVFPAALGDSSLLYKEKTASLGSIFRLRLPDYGDVEAAVVLLARNPDVVFAEPDYIARAAYTPTDPLYASQWGLAAIHAGDAWDTITGTLATTIAIIDGGIDLDHPDLANRLWINPGEAAANGLDDDNNGYIDDVNGWDFVYDGNSPGDENGHGTEVAGVAAAEANNNLGVAGVCWNCRLMVVKVMQASGIANYSDIAAGVAYAAAKGASVINISLGGYADSATLRAAIQAASARAVIVGGAGNDAVSSNFYPAAYPQVIAVAAVGPAGAKADFSNFGAWVDAAAPGMDIHTTFEGGDWGATSGTSLASSFVSGLAGLLYSQHPDWSPQLVRLHILQTASSLSASDPIYADRMGAGLVDAAQAMLPAQPLFIVDKHSLDGVLNGKPAPGTSDNALVISLLNQWGPAEAVSASLSTADPAVTVSTASASFGDIAAGEAANSTAFTFQVASLAGYNHDIPFSLQISANGGDYAATVPYTLTTRSPDEPVSGYIIADTLWTSEKIYVVGGDLTINSGVTLTIQAGTQVRFNGNYSLNVNGTLIADGAPDAPILFTSGTSGRWNRIYFGDTSPDAQAGANGNYLSGSILRNVILEASAGGVGCNLATPYLAFITSASSGIRCAPGSTPLWALDNTLSGGIYVTLGKLYAHRNTLSGSGLHATGSAVVMTNTVTGASLSIGSGWLAANIVNGGSLGLGSQSTAMDNIVTGGGISAGNTVTITRNTVTGGGISTGSASTIISNTVQNSPGAGLVTGNNVTARGNRLIGNAQGMVATTGKISYNLIADNRGPGLQVGAASVTYNTFTGNLGNTVVVQGQNLTEMRYNNFEANKGTYDLYVTLPWGTGMYVPATYNWWGTTDTAAIAARIYDFNDDGTKAKVTYINWLSGPSESAPGYVRGLAIAPDAVLGIQTGTFTVTYSRPMDLSFYPDITFFTAKRGDWDQYSPANSSLPSTSVSAAAVDLGDTPWFGTPANGAAHLVGSAWTLYHQG